MSRFYINETCKPHNQADVSIKTRNKIVYHQFAVPGPFSNLEQAINEVKSLIRETVTLHPREFFGYDLGPALHDIEAKHEAVLEGENLAFSFKIEER